MKSSQPATSIPRGTPADPKVQQQTEGLAKEIVARDAFAALMASLLVDKPTQFDFAGSIRRDHAYSVFKWLARDAVPDLNDRVKVMIGQGYVPAKAIEALAPEILGAAKTLLDEASKDRTSDQRLTVQLGGQEVRSQAERVLFALRSRKLIEKAEAFGRATNSITDERTLGTALQSMVGKQSEQAAMLMHVVVGQSALPGRLMAAAVHVVGRTDEGAIRTGGFAPLVEALLAHAQNQLATLTTNFGTFADIDLVCRSLDRFHRLVRAINTYVDLARNGHWAMVVAALTKTASVQVENRLKSVTSDLSFCLRRPGGKGDGIDPDLWLTALNGMYLLVAVRDARESLALNALFEQVWRDTGQLLESIISRNMEAYKANPANGALAERLEYGTKMAHLRFGEEYASILDRAREAHGRRAAG